MQAGDSPVCGWTTLYLKSIQQWTRGSFPHLFFQYVRMVSLFFYFVKRMSIFNSEEGKT